MRRRAIERGLRLNEYGLFPSDDSDEETAQEGVHCDDEEGIFRALDLAYIPPELREDCGEFEVATRGRMPRLLEWTDMKGSCTIIPTGVTVVSHWRPSSGIAWSMGSNIGQ